MVENISLWSYNHITDKQVKPTLYLSSKKLHIGIFIEPLILNRISWYSFSTGKGSCIVQHEYLISADPQNLEWNTIANSYQFHLFVQQLTVTYLERDSLMLVVSCDLLLYDMSKIAKTFSYCFFTTMKICFGTFSIWFCNILSIFYLCIQNSLSGISRFTILNYIKSKF